MAKFIDQNKLYRSLQRELPEGAYPDGSPSAFYSTASIYSKAQLAATAYANLERIYLNYFPDTADEKIDDWVIKAFGHLFSSATTLQEKRDRVIAQIRKQPSINIWELLKIVASYVPQGTFVQIYAPCGDDRWWTLGVSLLGINTILSGLTPVDLGVTDLSTWCSFVQNRHWRLGDDALGVNTTLADVLWPDLVQVQNTAYAYEVRIFGYTLSASDLESMSGDLTAAEPARSSFTVNQNLDLTTFGLTNPVTNVDQTSLVDCITRDPLSTTGYSGRTL